MLEKGGGLRPLSLFFLLRPDTPVSRCQVMTIGQSFTSWLSFSFSFYKDDGPVSLQA